jgi:lysophospholipase L1-like esterase
VIGLVALPVGALAVLGVEVQLARHGPDLPDDTPLEHDGLVGTTDGAPLRMVWLGDSTAAGVGASSVEHALPRRVAAALERPVDVTSLAVSGARIADLVGDQLDRLEALAAAPDVVVISIGANDVTHLTSRDDFRSAYDEVLAAAPAQALVVLLGVPDMGAPPRLLQPLRAVAGFRGRQLDGVTAAVAKEHGATYVDIAGETGPPMRSDTGRYFAEDRFHPSDEGYRLWADAVLEQLRPALVERERAA